MATSKKPRRAAAKPTRARHRKVAPEDLTNTRLVSDPQISPDGRRIVFVVQRIGDKNDKLTDLWLVDVRTSGRAKASDAPRRFTSSGKASQPRWSPDGTRIAFVSRRTDEHGDSHAQLWVISAEGGEARALTAFPEGSLGAFQWSPDGKHIAVGFRATAPEWTSAAKAEREKSGGSTPPRVIDTMFYRFDGDGYFQQQRHVLHVVNLDHGKHRPVFSRDTLGRAEFSWTPDSKALFVTANTDRKALSAPWKTQFWRVDVATGKSKACPKLPAGSKEAPAVSPDGRRVAYAGSEGSERVWGENNVHLWLADLKAGTRKGLTLDDDYCLAAKCISDAAEVNFSPTFAWAPDGKRLLLNIGWQGEMQIASVDAAGGKLKMLTRGEHVLGMGNLSADGKLVALTISTWDRPPEVAVGKVGRDRIAITRLSDMNAWMSELALSKPKATWVKSTGDTQVHTWLMAPTTTGARRPAGARSRTPAVLEIHGGPHGQYGVGYFHEFQVLAAAGYAVFYSNPRGSKGYGEAHCAAIAGNWGSVDWDDIQAVTAHMQHQGFVNTRAMGIMGGSYGGYMTNWAIGHCDDFAGAITDRCVSNMVSMMGNSDIMEPPDGYWRGNTTDRPETLWEQSPLRYLGRCTTPTLIIHSEGDLRCNVEQAEQVHAVLCHNNVPVRFVRYPSSTSHGMSRAGPPDLRIHRLHQILDWWKRWLRR